MKLQELCRTYNIRFKKQLGQNLLLDDNINRIMVEAAALTPEDDVIEVGAGLGALTERLVAQAGRVLAVEIDRAFMPCLEDQFGAFPNLRLFRGDILNHDLSRLLQEYLPESRSCKMVSNLPYYITTPVLFHFWESTQFFTRIVVMVQQEVAERMVAPVGGPAYCSLTLAANLYAIPDIIHRVPRSCFQPRPKVDSCIVRLRNHAEPRYSAPNGFIMRVVRAAFTQRRKTLRNALTRSGALGAPREVVLEAMDSTGIDDGRRAQTVSLDEFAALAEAIRIRL